MEMENSPKLAKTRQSFTCTICNYNCRKASDYDKHIITLKHLNGTQMEIAGNTKVANVIQCVRCHKQYKTVSGLWKHNKICIKLHSDSLNIIISETPPPLPEDIKTLTTMVVELIKSNSEIHKQHTELQKQMIDVCKNTNNTNTNTNTNISNNNNHNKTFNLQFFLNEQCKDAMNISDFTNSFDLQLSDLESVGELGYVDGITKIFIDRLNALDIYKRPMHCSDAKREIIYIKDNNIWTKEEKNNPKLRQAIKNVSFNNMKLVYNWSNAYPESKNNETRLADKYIKLVLQSSGGSGPILDSENKIIRRIAKEILIAKDGSNIV
jgi:hypothetical protein